MKTNAVSPPASAGTLVIATNLHTLGSRESPLARDSNQTVVGGQNGKKMKISDQYIVISRKKIEHRQWKTTSKSHMCFRLVQFR